MLNFLKRSKDKPKIQFDKSWDSYVVVKDSHILYTGSKEQCDAYLKNYAVT